MEQVPRGCVCTWVCREPQKQAGCSPDCCLSRVPRTPWQPTGHHARSDLVLVVLVKYFVVCVPFMPSVGVLGQEVEETTFFVFKGLNYLSLSVL